MFPLIISVSIVLQAVVFISVQSSNTTPILFDGCGRIVQLIFPGARLARALVVVLQLTYVALWLPFATMLVFGLEATFRSLRRVRFPSRNRWHIPTAIVVIALMIFSTWAATNVFPTRGKCLTGLIWWTARYAKLAAVLAVGLLVVYPASALIITVQLVKTVEVEKAERIAATRVVYYLVVNTWLIVRQRKFGRGVPTNRIAGAHSSISCPDSYGCFCAPDGPNSSGRTQYHWHH